MGNVSKADSLNRQALIAFSFSTHSQKGNMKKVPIERSDFGGQVEAIGTFFIDEYNVFCVIMGMEEAVL
ncbi:hypothetical protein MKA63_12580 [[Clostridium] innocuum]|uniref:Uncharacterized protein n=1 Tax=Clostridium innocuum TaxID=1522 RepID=A0AAP2XSA5_CLOIN|nr:MULTISPECIES: hypothetical protein [Thomasclavelia]MBU9106476.1 hypothetical protein [[Clostridium] innocuum]MBV4170576.1 hypothetical protein [[Clostridium] innocuum]MBV4341746.1 hypothetical protein [Erysipelatoclostridium sp. DFI.2.3]MCC2786235.1 hypothetical protein [[Clostridium] innocuum]MCC2791492.1 hypothetical protein [[Clostridium] innocuum]